MNNSSQKGEVKFGEQLTIRDHIIRSTLTSGPGIFWVTFFLLLPLVWIGVISFLTRTEVGGFPLTPYLRISHRFSGR